MRRANLFPFVRSPLVLMKGPKKTRIIDLNDAAIATVKIRSVNRTDG